MIGFLRVPHIRLLLTASLAVNLLALALPMMTMQIYNRVLPNQARETFVVLACGVGIAALAEFILRICRSILVGLNGARFEHAAGVEALDRLLAAEPRFTQRYAPTILAQHVGAVARLKDYYGGQMAATLLIDMPFIAVFIGFAFYLAGYLALVPCGMMLLFGALSLRHGRQLQKLVDEREALDDRRYRFVTETLQAVHVVKALCLEAVTARRFEESQRENGAVNYRISCLQGNADTLSYAAANVMTVAVICAGVPMISGGYLTVGTLIACVLLAGQIMPPLQRGLALWVRHQDIALAKARLAHIMKAPRRPMLALDQLAANHGALKIDGLRFGYRSGEPVIDGAQLALAPGETMVLRGAPGSGKTTLLELMAGLYRPDRGRIALSGMDVAAIPAAERARHIAYLPTQGLILRGSIMDNLTGFDSRQHEAAREMAKLLGIEQAVALLPAGYDTPLEALTVDLIPPGLKQRVAIARALLHKPRFILYDNADHGLDRESYTRVFELLARLKGRATMIIVSEDRNIASLADREWELRRGRLVMQQDEAAAPMIDRRWLSATPDRRGFTETPDRRGLPEAVS